MKKPGRKPDPNSMRARVFAMLDKGRSIETIIAAIPCTLDQAQVLRSKWKKAEHYKATADEWRRRRGQLDYVEFRARQRARSAARLAQIQPLLDQGMTWRKAAEITGISHNVIAGLTYRARANKQDGAA